MVDKVIELRMRAHGIKHPVWTLQQARKQSLRPRYACAMLMLETSGGRNIFGHDWDFAYAGQTVTKARYEALRAAINQGHPSTGVGPCQLTSVGLLDEADQIGGAWIIEHNLAVGFKFLHGLIQEHGSAQAGATAYNGSGPAAEEYGQRFIEYANQFGSFLA